MQIFVRAGILACGMGLLALTGCKTEVVNPQPSGTTVIHEDRPVVHDHDAVHDNTPPVQNNIHVDR